MEHSKKAKSWTINPGGDSISVVWEDGSTETIDTRDRDVYDVWCERLCKDCKATNMGGPRA